MKLNDLHCFDKNITELEIYKEGMNSNTHDLLTCIN